MSTLRAGDTLEVRLRRKVAGKFIQERVELDADAIRFMSTPELLRTFSAAIATASERLDITEEHAAGREVPLCGCAEEVRAVGCNACDCPYRDHSAPEVL